MGARYGSRKKFRTDSVFQEPQGLAARVRESTAAIVFLFRAGKIARLRNSNIASSSIRPSRYVLVEHLRKRDSDGHLGHRGWAIWTGCLIWHRFKSRVPVFSYPRAAWQKSRIRSTPKTGQLLSSHPHESGIADTLASVAGRHNITAICGVG